MKKRVRAIVVGVALILVVVGLRIWGAPAFAMALVGAARGNYMPPAVSKVGVLLFNNPLTADRKSRVQILMYHAMILRNNGDSGRAIGYAEKAAELAQGLSPTSPLVASANYILLDCVAQSGGGQKLATHVNGILRRAEERTGKDHPTLVPLLVNMSNVALAHDNPDLAQELAQRAISIVEKRGGRNDPAISPALDVLLMIAEQRENWDQAIAVAQRQAELKRRTGRDKGERELQALANIPYYAQRKGDDEKMLEASSQLAQRALALARDGKVPIDDAAGFVSQAVWYTRKIGRFEDAAGWLEAFIQLPKFEAESRPLTPPFFYLTLAECYAQMANYVQAQKYLEKVSVVTKQPRPNVPASFRKELENLAALCRERGRTALADQALAIAAQLPNDVKRGDSASSAPASGGASHSPQGTPAGTK